MEQALPEVLPTSDVVLFNSGDTSIFMSGEMSPIMDLTFVSSILPRKKVGHNTVGSE